MVLTAFLNSFKLARSTVTAWTLAQIDARGFRLVDFLALDLFYSTVVLSCNDGVIAENIRAIQYVFSLSESTLYLWLD